MVNRKSGFVMQQNIRLYEDLATLVENIISIGIKSCKKLSLIHFYDAYRGHTNLNDLMVGTQR
jgi:hypothetical protein